MSWQLEVQHNYTPLQRAFSVSNSLLAGAGPSNVSPRVLYAMSHPVAYPLTEEVYKIMDDTKDMLKYLFQTKNPVTLAAQTSGNGGLESIITNLVDPGETIIVAVGGVWGDRSVDMGKRYNVNVVRLTVESGEIFTFEELENEIIKHKPAMLFVTQGESSSGTHQPIEGLGDICHKYGCLLAVDAVVSLAAVPLFVDRWKIDACVGGTQKAVAAPAGFALLTFSPLAIERMLAKKCQPPFYLDVVGLANAWNCFGKIRQCHYTYNTNMLYALREALAQITEEGLVNGWARHQQNTDRLNEGLEKMGLTLFVRKPENRLNTVTTVYLPENVKWQVLLNYLIEKYRVQISFGIGPTAHRAIRIGVMGYNSRPEVVDYLLKVLDDGLKYCQENVVLKTLKL